MDPTCQTQFGNRRNENVSLVQTKALRTHQASGSAPAAAIQLCQNVPINAAPPLLETTPVALAVVSTAKACW